MPTTTDNDQRSAIDKSYERGHGAHLGSAENAAADHAQDQRDAFEREFGGNNYEKEGTPGDLSDGARRAEESPSQGNSFNYTGRGGAPAQKGLSKLAGLLKKRGPILGLAGGIGLGIGLAAILGPAAILIALMHNVTDGLDSASRAMSNRQQRVLRTKMAAPDCSEKSFKCQKSKLSNKTLRRISSAGLTPLVDGKPIDISKRTGYPEKKPTAYRLADGKTTVPAADISKHIHNDTALRGRLFGPKGVFNGRLSAWSGKHMRNKFQKIFNIKKDGGTSDGKNTKTKGAERTKAIREKIGSRIEKVPGMKQGDQVVKKIEGLLGGEGTKEGRLKTAKAGGVLYQAAFGGCIASKIPSMTTAAIAGAQLLRLLPYISELVLSPAVKLMASGVDPENAATSEDVDMSASILTEKTLDKNGNLTAAVDSPLFLAALGVNKAKISPAEYGSYIPGYSAIQWFNQGAGRAWKTVQEKTSKACSYIMSPVAMYAWSVVETAITGVNPIAAAGKMILGAGASMAIQPLVMMGVKKVVGLDTFQDMLLGGFLEEDLQGIELGHTLGASALAFFPAGAMARFVPGVAASSVSVAEETRLNYENNQREMALASMNPLDASSKYTFLGSIVHSLRMSAITNGSYSRGGIGATLRSVLNIPQLALTPGTFAATSSSMSNIYNSENAAACDLESETSETTPLLNILCMPQTELPDLLDPDEAIAILEENGLLDLSDDKEVSEGADIDELVKKGIIVKDTELYALAAGETGCNDASSGNYLIEAAGCIIPGLVQRSVPEDRGCDGDKEMLVTVNENTSSIGCYEKSEEGSNSSETPGAAAVSTTTQPSIRLANSSGNSQVILAAYTFLLDVQAGNAITGEDDEELSGGSSGSTADGSIVTGGMNLSQAQAFMSAYLTDPSATSLMGTSSLNCNGGPHHNCTSFSMYFINKYTSIQGMDGSAGLTGNGFEVTSNVKNRNPGMKSGTAPQPYAIFSNFGGTVSSREASTVYPVGGSSFTDSGGAVFQSLGHTGVVLGVDEASDTMITGEAHCMDGYTAVHVYKLSDVLAQAKNGAWEFVYAEDSLKDGGLK